MPHKTRDPPAGGGGKYQAQMYQIFQNVQFNIVQHKKYIKELTKIYKKMEEGEFRASFSTALHYLFTFGDTSANVDRVVQFVATFCTSLDDDEDFLLFIFDIIFSCQCVSGQSVRYRASQLLAAVLTALGEDASLDDDLCDKLLTSQMERLQDTRGAVRCRAALALQRLQNPMEPDDAVTRAYRFHMSCDPSSSVRRAIVMSIAKCSRNIPFILERLCDVDEAVRRAAFIYISAINVTQLKVRQRVHVLKVGLTERSPRVRRVVEEILLPGWLSTFKGNIVDLLTSVRLDNATGAKDSQYVAGKLLESLFKRLPISELLEWLPTDKTLRVIPAAKLGKETAWYWRHLAEHLIKMDDDETLETVLPDLVVLTGYVRAIVESPCPDEKEDPVGYGTRQYVLHELARLLKAYDASDEVGRASLQQLLFDVLTGDHGPLSEEVVGAFVAATELILPEVSRRVEFVVSVVTELREPSEPEPAAAQPAPAPQECTEIKLQRARLRVSLNVAQEAQEEAVKEQNYSLAAECKEKVELIQRQLEELNTQPAPLQPAPLPPTIREKIDDPAVLNQCLQILNMALDTPHITTITPLLKMVFDELEDEIFSRPELVENALKTVALYGMLNAEFAKEHKSFFIANLVDLGNERVVCTVLRCIMDLLCVHGARLFEDEPNTSNTNKAHDITEDSIISNDVDQSDAMILPPTHGTIIDVLLNAMENQCNSYRLIVVEGLCRLMILGHLESPSILSRFLLLWFSPASEEEDLLRQTIGVFFQTFAVSVDGAQEQIQKATVPTLKALANAPAHSPLAEIDHDSMIRFIVSLTRVQHEMSDSQGGMALLLVSRLVEECGNPVAGLMCRCLSLLQPPRDPQLASDLAKSLRDILLDLPDKTSARNVSRYLGSLEAMERATMTKMSTMATMATINELSRESEGNDTGVLGRATSSLPAHPLARSTHIVVNETLEEEVEIDESSPEETAKQKKEVPKQATPPRRRAGSDGITSFHTEGDRRHSDSDRRVTLVRGSRVLADFDSPIAQLSSDLEIDRNSHGADLTKDTESPQLSDSSDSSPRKRPRVVKGGKKVMTHVMVHEATRDTPVRQEAQELRSSADEPDKRTKRKRDQRSAEDLNRSSSSPTPSTSAARTTKGKKTATDTPKPTRSKKKIALDTPVRRSPRVLQSSSSSGSASSTKSTKSSSGKSTGSAKSKSGESQESERSKKSEKTTKKGGKAPQSSRRSGNSVGSTRSSEGARSDEEIADSADETMLHTIVYDREMVQSVMADSSDDESFKNPSKGNVTVPETPESSERSSSASPPPARARSKNTKKK